MSSESSPKIPQDLSEIAKLWKSWKSREEKLFFDLWSSNENNSLDDFRRKLRTPIPEEIKPLTAYQVEMQEVYRKMEEKRRKEIELYLKYESVKDETELKLTKLLTDAAHLYGPGICDRLTVWSEERAGWRGKIEQTGIARWTITTKEQTERKHVSPQRMTAKSGTQGYMPSGFSYSQLVTTIYGTSVGLGVNKFQISSEKPEVPELSISGFAVNAWGTRDFQYYKSYNCRLVDEGFRCDSDCSTNFSELETCLSKVTPHVILRYNGPEENRRHTNGDNYVG